MALLPRLSAQTPNARDAQAAKLALPLQLAPAQTAYRVQVQDALAFRRWAARHLPAARLQAAPGQPGLLTITGVADAAALTAHPLVQFVDVADRRAQPEREIDGVDLGANRIWSVHALYPQLDGRGLTASVKEEPFDANDIDFAGRVLTGTVGGGSFSDHATIMATFIGGAGNSAPTGRGAAAQVRLASASYANLLPDDGAQLAANGVTVQNHSYGVAAVESYYGLEARAYDQQTRQYPALLHVFSSGNRGNQTSPAGSPYAAVAGVANLTGQFKQSKNTLSVGATDVLGRVAPLSSRGPAHDGRLKPEVVALGEAGTSDAAALVSGTAVLLQHAYRNQSGSGALPSAALTKAVLINSADDVGRPGPDFEAGYGQTDALGAVQTMVNRQFYLDAVTSGATRSFPLTVPAGVRQLKLTLVWADAEAAAGAAQALINDLDLELVAAGGQRWRPWVLSTAPNLDSLRLPARRGLDRLNNVEQVTLAAPAAGVYQVQVRGHRLGAGSSQDFAVAYELETPGLDWSNPAGAGTALRADQPQRLRWQWRGPAGTGRLEYRLGAAGAWQLITANADLAAGLYLWTPPDVSATAQLRLVVGSTEYSSAAFALSRPAVAEVAYYCPAETSQPGEFLLAWPPVPGVTQYRVLRLGATQLEPQLVVADTAVRLTASPGSPYYGVEPLLPGGVAGVRGRSVDYTSGSCYVRSFLPRQLVASQVEFELVLGTTSRLARIYLERQSAAGFEVVQTITPGRRPQFVLTDTPPGPGRYTYRARLETQAGRVIYTRSESAYFAPVGNLVVFPNPVTAGQPLTVLDAEQRVVHWQLYDHLGRLVREANTDEGTLGQVPTAGLRAGAYILRLRPAGGSTVTHRMLVLH